MEHIGVFYSSTEGEATSFMDAVEIFLESFPEENIIKEEEDAVLTEHFGFTKRYFESEGDLSLMYDGIIIASETVEDEVIESLQDNLVDPEYLFFIM